MNWSKVAIGAGIVTTGAAGFIAAGAIGAGNQAATTTTTINVATGPVGATGPQGPTGPSGPPGGTSCPAGFEEGELVINHPGGQVTLFTCLKH